jgi:hypothetical protein
MVGAGVDGNTLDETLLFDRFAVVPEPGAALLFGTGLLLLCAIRRK